MSPIDAVVAQIDELLEAYADGTSGTLDPVMLAGKPDAEARALSTRLAAAIERLAPETSSYVRAARAVTLIPAYAAEEFAGILRALREDYAAGYMTTVEELIHAD